jgi:hypothetical protein
LDNQHLRHQQCTHAAAAAAAASHCRPIDLCIWTSSNGDGDIALMLLDHGATAMPAAAAGSSSSSAPSAATATAAAASSNEAMPVYKEPHADSKCLQPCELLSNALRIMGKGCPLALVQRLVQQGSPLDVVNTCGGGTAVLYAVMFNHTKVRAGWLASA